ncbi:hypothetical protein, partial [Streptomyces sp. NPDC006012]|uniref:hypothetical protein n=1 Tax=Streptomyces sp. NPDC006012 TaxID=3364739 RepID=UPI00368456A3
MRDLLNPASRASLAEEKALTDAGIPLLERKGGGYHINPEIKRENDDAIAQARADRALNIAKLYGLAPGYPALVEHGVLPKQERKGAPDWEQQARQRMYGLLKPENRASSEEEEVLRKARIPLVPRKGGGYNINPQVKRENDDAIAQAEADRALDIAKLYGLIKDIDALVKHGILPTRDREEAPPWERQARRRLHNLLKPENRTSSEEEEVLRKARIPLVPHEDGGYNIDPQVKRENDDAIAQAGADRALNIAKLYGLAPGYPALVEHGVLPKRDRKDAPRWEQQARHRLHDLLKRGVRASSEEEEVLRKARIPLLSRKDGGYYINPGIERQDDEDNAQVRADRALNI